MAKLHDVLGQDLRPLRMGLVAVETAPLGQGGTQTRRLAARGRTEVEGRDGRVDKLADDVVDEHRRGLLHIVGSSVGSKVKAGRLSR